MIYPQIMIKKKRFSSLRDLAFRPTKIRWLVRGRNSRGFGCGVDLGSRYESA